MGHSVVFHLISLSKHGKYFGQFIVLPIQGCKTTSLSPILTLKFDVVFALQILTIVLSDLIL